MQWRHLAAHALGWVTTLPYRWRSNVHLGPRLLGNGRLRISGPGRVEFGADVNAWSHAEVNRLITTRPEAVIHIGRHARLNGCTIVAADRVEVGADCVLGSCEVRDHLPYSESPDERRRPGEPRPVVIGPNVWIGGGALVVALATGLSRAGSYNFVYAGELIGISLMFFGFRFAASPPPKAAPTPAPPPYLIPAGSATQSRVT